MYIQVYMCLCAYLQYNLLLIINEFSGLLADQKLENYWYPSDLNQDYSSWFFFSTRGDGIPDLRLDISYHDVADQIITSLLQFKPEEWGLSPF